MSKRRNTFSRALRQLKSEEIDKKIQLTETLPTNNTMGVFISMPPGAVVSTVTVQRDVVGEADLDFDQDDASENGRDTTGLFETDGTIKAVMPPGDISYILGPMSAMYYGWWNSSSGGTTTVGYIRQSDRKMVNLGTITGKLHEWDGSSFSSYGQLTLEQAQWFKDIKKKDDAGNDPANANYRAFYPGPPSNSPDANGRYLCTITGQPRDKTTTQNVEVPHSPTEKGEMSADDNFAALMDREANQKIFSDIMDKINKGIKLSKKEEEFLEQQGLDDFYKGGDTQSPLGNLALLGATAALVKGAMAVGIAGLGKLLGFGKHAGATLGAQKAGEFLGQQIVDFGSPVVSTDSAFNKQLAVNLLTSIFTGKTNHIKISQGLSNNAIKNVNLKNLENNITIGTAPNYNTAEYNVNPKNKSQIFTKELSAQGGSMVNYDPKTDTLTIVSPKTLRTNQEGDKFDITQGGQVSGDTVVDKGKQTHFADIPSPSQESVESKVKALLGKSYVDSAYSGISGAVTGQITGGDGKTYSNAWDMIKNDNSKDADGNTKMDNFVKGAAEQSNKLATGAIQKVAVEAVAFRKALIKLGIPTSETEQTGDAYGHVMSQSTYKGNQIPAEIRAILNKKTTNNESYLLESKASRVLKNLKKPVVLPDTKQKKYKVKPGARMRGMDKLIGDIKPQESYKEPQKIWSKNSQGYNARSSQEKKNQVLQYVGASMDHWDYMTDTVKKQGGKIMANYKDHDYLYDYWLGGTRKKAVRKEEVKGDYVVFLDDGTSMLQSSYNEKIEQEKEKEMFDEYYKLNPKNEPIPYENDPLFKKVSKRLKPVIDYPEKPAKKGYPNEPPPKMVNGWHPEYGQRYKYDKLDPVSAKAMPPTGNPEIDANVEKTKAKPK